MTTRRSFITGLISFAVTAPAIVRAGSLMPVKVAPFDPEAVLNACIDYALRQINPPYGIGPAMQALPPMSWRVFTMNDMMMANSIIIEMPFVESKPTAGG